MRRLTALLLLAAAALGSAAQAQIALYEDRLPDGYALVRFVNTTDRPVDIRPDFTDPVHLGTGDVDRISPYRVVEDVAGRSLSLRDGAATVPRDGAATPRLGLQPGRYHTFLITGRGASLAGTLVTDEVEYNQLRAKLSFYNAAPGCSSAALLLLPGLRPVFTGLGQAQMRTRTVNPVNSAEVTAVCGQHRLAPLALGELGAGGLYTVWLMAPAGQEMIFLARDTIAPYQR